MIFTLSPFLKPTRLAFLAFILSWLSICPNQLAAQEMWEPSVKIISVSPQLLPSDTVLWAEYLMQKMAGKQNLFSLRIKSKSQFRSTTQFRYELLLQGNSIRNGWVQLSIYNQKQIAADLSFPEIDFADPGEIERFPASKSEEGSSYFYDLSHGNWRVVRAENHHSLKPQFESYVSYYDLDNNLLGTKDWLDYFQSGPDSIVKATVFQPDPSSRLQMLYGTDLKDRSDSNSIALSEALDTCYIPVLFFQDTFQLHNTRFEMGEFSDPVRPLARQTSPDFCFSRDNPFFEEVNAYYHLNRFRKYVDSLGFQQYADYSLRVDAHGMNGADQSAYSPILDVLAFGEGGVDDAEDATVIVHEYGHALANDANPLSNSGQERRSLEEGICDYLAGSYCKRFSTWNWQDIYKWDGHNEFWAGRTVMSTKHYPEDLVNQIHLDGEIWSSAMMNIELQIGRDATHEILFSALSSFAPNIKYPQAAYLFLKADTVLNGTIHGNTIRQIFESKGIGPGPIIVGNTSSLANTKAGFWGFWNEGGQLNLKNLPMERSQIILIDQQGREIQRFEKPIGESNFALTLPQSANSFCIVRIISAQHVESKVFLKPN